jgi:hypothetical protein
MKQNLLFVGAVIALVGSIAGGVLAIEARYARTNSVSANSQQIAIIRIENAYRAGKSQRANLRRMCDDFKRVHGWTPSACKF